jgi:hypothetical protein
MVVLVGRGRIRRSYTRMHFKEKGRNAMPRKKAWSATKNYSLERLY